MYYILFAVDYKRKGGDENCDKLVKSKKFDKTKCSDLIVLGIPWKSTEEDLNSYFSKFGDLLMVQVCCYLRIFLV